MPTTLPGDVEAEDEATPAELAEKDQTDAAFRDITENYGKTAPTSGSSKIKGKVSGSKSALKKKILIGGGIGGGLVGIGIILFFLLLFKNVHIKNLFIAYEFARFNRGFRNRINRAIVEAQPTGTANTVVDPKAPPAEQLKGANAEEIKKLQKADPKARDEVRRKLRLLDQSKAGTGGDVDAKLKMNRKVPKASGKSDKVMSETDANIKREINKGGPAKDGPIEATKEAGKEVNAALDEAAKTKRPIFRGSIQHAAVRGFTRGLNSVVGSLTGPFIIFTLGCIAREIYVTGYDAVVAVKYASLASAAQEVNKYADCQKVGKCSMAQINAMASKFDNNNESFVQSAAYDRVTNQPVRGPDLDTNLRPSRKLSGDQAGQIGSLLKMADTVDNLAHIPLLGKGCEIILKPTTQIIAATLGVGTIVLGIATDTISFGMGTVIQAATFTAAQLAATKVGAALALDAALHYGGGLFKQDFSPIQWGNLMGAGTKAIASESCRANGCKQLTEAENTELAIAIHADMVKEQQSRGIAYRLFSPENPVSTLGLLADRTPSSPKAMVGVMSRFVATVFSPQKLSKGFLAMINPIRPAWAANTEFGTYGIPDYGFTDAELNKYSVIENSDWVQANVTEDDRKRYDECFEADIGDILVNNENKFDRCNSSDDPKFERYRIYKLDSRVTHGLVLLYNKQPGASN